MEELKAVLGYEGIYAVNFVGEVFRLWKSGAMRISTVINRRGVKTIRLTKDGKRKDHILARLVWMAWRGPIPKGLNVYHVNGDKLDPCITNLKLITPKQLGKQTGAKSRRKTVAKRDEHSNVVSIYSSARQAGRENYMSYQTIIDRCNGKVKSRFAPDGYEYRWDEDVQY